MNAASLEDTAMDHEVGKGDNAQNDEPRRPGMELVSMAVVIERQEAEDEEVDGGHVVAPVWSVSSMNGAIPMCSVAVQNTFHGPERVMHATCIMML